MKQDEARYTLRTTHELLDKFGFIADYDGRTKNQQMIVLIKNCIRNFEKKHGPIVLEKQTDEKED